MATRKSKSKAAKRNSATSRASESKVTVDRGESRRETSSRNEGFLDKIQTDLEKNQSYLNLILGALIVVVLGVLIFNYFNKPAEQVGNVTPEATQTAQTDENGDVTKESLPGKYKVKEGDTLFLIAQKYYDDGGQYQAIVKENNLPGENIEVGQELTIPKVETTEMAEASGSPEASASPEASPSPETAAASPQTDPDSPDSLAMESASPLPASGQASPAASAEFGTGGATNQTVWGESITGDKYTVQAGDWLSKIAGRAYGDIYQYEKIAKANNISNADAIEVGTVLSIPR